MNSDNCQINFDPGGKKTILSVDGGGMKGTIAVAMLAELEKHTGKTCPQLFDLVAGTSSGAIIAAGFGLGLSAQELLEEVYRKRLPGAFRPSGILLWLRYVLTGLRFLYPLEPFRAALEPLAQGKRIGALQKPIVLMTTKDLRTSNTYFVVSRGPGAEAFKDWPVAGAVAASGAAPIYFPPVGGDLVDGGVGVFQNPSLPATVEAMEYIGADEDFVDGNVIHISLGTGYKSNAAKPGAGAKFWLLDWIRYVISESLDDALLQQTLVTRAIYGQRIDFRRYNVFLDRDNIADKLGIALAGRPDPAKFDLAANKPEQIDLMEEMGRVYACNIDWSLPGLMPWDTVGGHEKPQIRQEPVDWKRAGFI